MEQLGEGGPFVLPPMPCTSYRQEFLKRGNFILGFYTAISLYAEQGNKANQNAERKGTLTDTTNVEVDFGDSAGSVHIMNYGLLKKLFSSAGAQLTNQVSLMVYGNFEAYMFDLVIDGLGELKVPDPEGQAIDLLMKAKWPGKLERLSQTFSLGLGKRMYVNEFKDLDMGFLGEACADPQRFLAAYGRD